MKTILIIYLVETMHIATSGCRNLAYFVVDVFGDYVMSSESQIPYLVFVKVLI